MTMAITINDLEAKQPLPNTPFVSLAEALSWIAFGNSMDHLSLSNFLDGQLLDESDCAHVELSKVVAAFTAQARGGLIGTSGKFVCDDSVDHWGDEAETIAPVKFDDYRRYDVLFDGFCRGTGLYWNDPNGATGQQSPAFRTMRVKRSDLLNCFPEAGSTGKIWTPDEMKKWWTDGGYTNGKKARNSFMELSDTGGLSESFSTAWKKAHPGREKGRPKIRN